MRSHRKSFDITWHTGSVLLRGGALVFCFKVELEHILKESLLIWESGLCDGLYFPKTMATKSPTCSSDVILTLFPLRERVFSMLPPLKSSQAHVHSKGDSVWLLKLDHTLCLSQECLLLEPCHHAVRKHKHPHGEPTVTADGSRGPSRQTASNCQGCEQVSLQISSLCSLWIFPAEGPDITEQSTSQLSNP